MLLELFGLVGAVFIVYAAVTNKTTISAITQMGSIQERLMPWATFSKAPPSQQQQQQGVPSSSSQAELDTLSSTAKHKNNNQNKSSSSSPSAEQSGATTTLKAEGVAQTGLKKVEKALYHVRTKDKVIYTAGVINVVFTAFLLGSAPQYFYLWHTPKTIVYITHRIITFRREKQHYLLFDFCYFANFLSLLYIWCFPTSAVMFQILFVTANGPLAWSILAFTQSLIFHSAPHMTSVFIHTSPALLSYAIRWSDPAVTGCVFADGDPLAVSAYDLIWNAVSKFYGWWVVFYYVWIFVIRSSSIRKRGLKTLFDRVISRGPTRYLVKVSSNELVQKTAYMCTHVVFALFTMSLTVAFFRSQLLHIFFITCICSVSSWNGSSFYFSVFLARYEDELRQRAGLPKLENNEEENEAKKKK